MKLFALASLLATVIICPVSEARSIKAQDHYVLRNVTINGVNEGLIADVTLNYVQNTIQVSIVQDICGHYAELPPGTMRCMAMPIPRAELEVPMQKRAYDGCHSFVTSGVDEKRPVDGNRTEITVINHETRFCENVITSLIEVRATTFGPRGGQNVYEARM